MLSFPEQYERYRQTAEDLLIETAQKLPCGTVLLKESILYSLLAGGKRIRPVLFFAAANALGVDYIQEKAFAVALECIHTYSLIHDDLPAMDNDDFRRGKPSNHKVFGEGNAILAGDGLLSYAFELLISQCARGKRQTDAAKTLAAAAGIRGMVAGQSADLFYSGNTNRTFGQEELFALQRDKTAKMIAAPLIMAANLAGKYEAEFENFGLLLGSLFQITDDILDVIGESKAMGKTLGKDVESGKLTVVSLLGLEGATALADERYRACIRVLDGIQADTDFLRELARSVRERKN